MSCPEHLISALGRRGVGVVQPQSGLDYPFVAPSADIKYLIADFHLSIDDLNKYNPAAEKFEQPFFVKQLYGVGCVENEPDTNFLTPEHAADIVIGDKDGRTVFDSTSGDVMFHSSPWGPDYRLYSWRTPTVVCNLLAHTTWADTDDEKRYYNKYLVPEDARLDARAVYVLPKRVLSLRTKRVDDPTLSAPITGHVTFKNGYNTEITARSETTNNFLVTTPIVFSATAGSGLGKYSTCGDDPAPVIQAVRKINGISVPTGDFLLSATDCLYVRRPAKNDGDDVVPDDYFDDDTGALVRPLSIGANCGACCNCQDYVDLARNINQYQSQYVNIGARVNYVKQLHEQNIQRWIDERSCGLQNPLRLLMVPQRCPYMDIVLMICNPCSDCLYSKELQLELEPETGTDAFAEIVPGYTAMFSANSNGRPVPVTQTVTGRKTILTVQFATVKSSDSAYVRFRVKFSTKSEYAVTGTLTGKLLDNTPILSNCAGAEERISAAAIDTQSLYCDANGNTNLP